MSPTKKTPAEQAAQKRYMAGKATIQIVMSPQERETIKAHAAKRNESVNAFINRAIKEQISRDSTPNEP